MLPHLSVAKRGYISEGNLAEVVPYTLYKLKTWLSVAVYFCVCMMVYVSSMPCNRSRSWLTRKKRYRRVCE